METPTVSAISLIPADFASADPALEREALRVCPPDGLRLSFEDFTGRYGLAVLGGLSDRELLLNRIKFTDRMRSQLDCQSESGI